MRFLCADPDVGPSALDDMVGACPEAAGTPLRVAVLLAGRVEDLCGAIAARAREAGAESVLEW